MSCDWKIEKTTITAFVLKMQIQICSQKIEEAVKQRMVVLVGPSLLTGGQVHTGS